MKRNINHIISLSGLIAIVTLFIALVLVVLDLSAKDIFTILAGISLVILSCSVLVFALGYLQREREDDELSAEYDDEEDDIELDFGDIEEDDIEVEELGDEDLDLEMLRELDRQEQEEEELVDEDEGDIDQEMLNELHRQEQERGEENRDDGKK
mgnify:CR=1 FL=1